ncbi:hypothetical protein [Streptomyces sp. NPDC001268]|uniref:hypothetical protein n=1 Tax=Streptomyces sp. NPDC001268 TaxID=3364553 RepID=UPI0036A6290A
MAAAYDSGGPPASVAGRVWEETEAIVAVGALVQDAPAPEPWRPRDRPEPGRGPRVTEPTPHDPPSAPTMSM